MGKLAKPRAYGGAPAFTLIEIIVTMVILAIVALIAVPMMSGAATMQVRGAANRLAADLEYAKNMAITHQRPFTVVFDTNASEYAVYDSADTDPIIHPVTRREFVVSFAAERGLRRVRIETVELEPAGSDTALTFDFLGTPLVEGAPLDSGEITLTSDDGFTLIVAVEPMTGYITIEGAP